MLPIALSLIGAVVPEAVKYFTNSDTAGKVAAQVIDIAKTVTGTETPEEAHAAISVDPALAMQFRAAVLASESELEKAYLADRADARKRDTAFITSGRYNWRGDILAVLAVGALCLCVWMVATNPALPAGAREAIMFVAGVFSSAVRDVYGFEFGSSRSSKEKDAAITNLTNR